MRAKAASVRTERANLMVAVPRGGENERKMSQACVILLNPETPIGDLILS